MSSEITVRKKKIKEILTLNILKPSLAVMSLTTVSFALSFSGSVKADTYCRAADIPLGEVVTGISTYESKCGGSAFQTNSIQDAWSVCDVPNVKLPPKYYVKSKLINTSCWDGSVHYDEIDVHDSNSGFSEIEICYGDIPNAYKHGTSKFKNSEGPHYDWYVSSVDSKNCDKSLSIYNNKFPSIAQRIEPFSENDIGAIRVFRACKGFDLPPYAQKASDFISDRSCGSYGQSAEYTVSFDRLCPTVIGQYKPYSSYTKAICPPPKPQPIEKCLAGTLYGSKGSNIKLYSVDRKQSVTASNGKLVMKSGSSQTWTLQDKNNDGEFGILNSAGIIHSTGKGATVSVKPGINFSNNARWVLRDSNSDGIYAIVSADVYHGSLYKSTNLRTGEFVFEDKFLFRVCEVK